MIPDEVWETNREVTRKPLLPIKKYVRFILTCNGALCLYGFSSPELRATNDSQFSWNFSFSSGSYFIHFLYVLFSSGDDHPMAPGDGQTGVWKE